VVGESLTEAEDVSIVIPLYARALVSLNNYGEARGVLEQYVENPTVVAVMAQLSDSVPPDQAVAWARRSLDAAVQSGEPVSRTIAAAGLFDAALAAGAEAERDEAASVLRATVDELPAGSGPAEVFVLIASRLEKSPRQADREVAVRAWERVLQLEENSVVGRVNLAALILRDRGGEGGSRVLKLVTPVIENPGSADDARAYANDSAARASLLLNDTASALTFSQEAISLGDRAGVAGESLAAMYLTWAEALHATGDTPGAKSILSQAENLAQDPDTEFQARVEALRQKLGD
jgi:tetratricopeptide (TPR) repeat protein